MKRFLRNTLRTAAPVTVLVTLLLTAAAAAAQDAPPAEGDAPTAEESESTEEAGATGESGSTEESGSAEEAAPPAANPANEGPGNADWDGAAAAHNGWMLVCCALVLFMTAPGLAMFYSGLVRKKNVLSVMMQCLFLMGLMTVLWSLYGYSLAFGQHDEGHALKAYVGDGDYLFMKDVGRTWNEAKGEANEHMEGDIPRLTHMLFQGMFFIITPALICGAFAERMKFSAMVAFSVLWGTLVYCPLCHWVWGGGILAFDGDAFGVAGAETASWSGGALDFAGGTVVHISSGVSALVCAMFLGRRRGWGTEDMRPHNLTYTALGAAMLWVGWFGFNAGSELLSDHLTASAFAVTHFSAAAGVLSWSLYEWITRGKPSVLGAASGAVAGLVCITPAAGFVNPMEALIMGAAAGIVCAIAVGLKNKLGYDDSLDAFGVHGIGGTLGAILTGVFATRACWDIAGGKPLGWIEAGSFGDSVMMGQLVATGVTWVFSIAATIVILLVLQVTIGLRVSEEGERRGLDLADHEEEGYILN